MDYCYVEFESVNEEALKRLEHVVEVIKEDRNKDDEETDQKWIGLFLASDLDHFWWPNAEQYDQVRQEPE